MRISDWSSDVCSSDLRDHIWEVYGATEGLVRCWIGGREWLERPGSVGRPIGGGRLRILRDDGQECEAGEESEVFAMPPGGPGSTYRYICPQRRATADGLESVGSIGRRATAGVLHLADQRTAPNPPSREDRS